jgi:hypothetical protein
LGRDTRGSDLNHDAGACAICRGTGGVIVLVISRLSMFWVAVTTRVGCTFANSVTLGCGISTLGIGASTLGMCVACRAAWFAQTLSRMVLAFASSFFAIAILVNSLLTFCNASGVSFPVGMFPSSVIVSCCAAATTWDSGETVGFVMYWCLKNTVSLIRVALVCVM